MLDVVDLVPLARGIRHRKRALDWGGGYGRGLKVPLGRPALPGRVACQWSRVSLDQPKTWAFPSPIITLGGGKIPLAR